MEIIGRRIGMETVRIGVIVSDMAYRNALLRGLSHESRDLQFISASARDDDRMIRACQIVIADTEALEGEKIEKESGTALIHLTYREMYDSSYSGSEMEIFRYEDARVFVNKIIYYYAKVKGIDLYFHGKRKCRKVVFSSVSGGCGTTSAAITSARFLKYRFGKKTLFMSLCPFDGSRKFTGSGDGGNIVSLLYHLKAQDDVPLGKFISSSEGVDHFRGQSNNRLVAEMTVSDLKRLIQMIDEMGDYEFVIFDVGTNLGSLAKFLFERADVHVVVRQKNGFDEEPQRGGENPGADDTGKVIRVTDLNEEVLDGDSDQDKDDVLLTYDPDAFVRSENRVKIDIRGRYGRDVSHLAEKIIGSSDEWS